MPALDPQLQDLLDTLRRRVHRYLAIDSLLVLGLIVLTAFWAGIALDYLPVKVGGSEMPRSARSLLAIAVAIALVMTGWRLLVRPLLVPVRDDSLALLIERQHPELGGRLVTAVQLHQPDRSGDAHSSALLEQVHREAVRAAGSTDLDRVFRPEPIRRKLWMAIPLAVFTLLFAGFSPTAFAHAAKRLLLLSDAPWPRLASLHLVGVELPLVSLSDGDQTEMQLIEFQDGVARLPRGSSGTLRLLAKADDGAVVPEVCTLFFRSSSGVRGQSNLRRVGRVTDGFQAFVLDGAPLAAINESVTFSIQGLDARLDNYRLEAVAPPALDRLEVTVSDPAYLRTTSHNDARTVPYQAGLRIREGASAVLTARSSVPLGRVIARVAQDGMLRDGSQPQENASAGVAGIAPAVQLSDDGLQLQLTLDDIRQPTTVLLVPEDREAISAQLPYRYHFGVVQDEKPQIELRLKGIGTAVTPIARLPLQGSVRDDYGIDQAFATLSILPRVTADTPAADESDHTSTPEEPQSVRRSFNQPLTLGRDGDFDLTIDLRALSEDRTQGIEIPESGSSLNLLGEASDHYNLDGRVHRVTSQLFQLNIVTADQLLAILERRELSLRGRLEQTIEEAKQLRDNLDALRADLASGDSASSEERQRQIFRLRSQQMGLQVTKTSEELSGMAVSLDELLEEMANNRVDSVDRSQRIGGGVRDPLRSIVAGELEQLRQQITAIQQRLGQPPAASPATSEPAQVAAAVQTADQVVLRLNAVLEKMLDLESFNELLDIVRDLLELQDGLIEKAQKEQKARVLDLFE